MKISIIIPNYNDIRIERTLSSIYQQTYKNFEVIVVDGLSKKEEVYKIYKKFPIHTLINEKDQGIFDALNKGVKSASGDIIYLLGSDDFLEHSDTFQKVIDTLAVNHELDGACIGCQFFKENKVIRKWFSHSISSRKIKLGILPPHFSLFLKRKICQVGK